MPSKALRDSTSLSMIIIFLKESILFLLFKGLRRRAIKYFHVVTYFSIQINGKLDVDRELQNVTMVIVYGVKCAFEKFRMQCVIKDTV